MKSKTINTELIDRAIAFAVKAHKGIARKGTNVPYIAHPMEAMTIVSTITDDQELMAAAMLHDVVEDTAASLDDIRNEFGSRVADIVTQLTDSEVNGLAHDESWQQRKQAAISRLAKAPHDVQVVALADKLSNLRTTAIHLRLLGNTVWQRFNNPDPASHAWHYRQLAQALSPLAATPAYQEFTALIRQTFGENQTDKELFKKINDTIRKERLYTGTELRRKEIMKRFGIGRHHLNALLSTYADGKTFPQFVNAIRMEEAYALLTDHPEMTIADVAREVGFTPPNLREQFKRHYGMTPRAYRKGCYPSYKKE